MGVKDPRISDLGQLFTGAKFRKALTGFGEVAKRGYGQFSGIFQDIALELEHDHAGASSLLEC